MVCARQPQCWNALHPFGADQNILQCLIQCMPHMQLPRNIRRGNHNGIGLLVRLYLGRKATGVLPGLVELVLHGLKIIRLFGNCFGHIHFSPLVYCSSV